MKQICGSTYEHYKPIQTKTKLECSMSRRRRYVWLTASGGLWGRHDWGQSFRGRRNYVSRYSYIPFSSSFKNPFKSRRTCNFVPIPKDFVSLTLFDQKVLFFSLVEKLIDCVLASHKVYFSLQQLTSAFVLCFNIKRKLLIQKTLSPSPNLYSFYILLPSSRMNAV